jgi:hypothetical protein
MVVVRRPSSFFAAALAAGLFFVSLANAAIPAGYNGKPYPPGSAPKEIPGRINFHDYDCGGLNVGFYADDQAYSGVTYSNAGGRDGKIAGIVADNSGAWPACYLTSHTGLPENDTFYAAGVTYPNGAIYPGPDTATAHCDWYIGASHANSWTKWTVHVAKAGKYWLSSIWAADAYPISFRLVFMNGANTVTSSTPSISGSGSWHAWRKYSDILSVQLDSGVQVLQFQNNNVHLNQNFLFFAADSGQFTTADLSPVQKKVPTSSSSIAVTHGSVRFSFPDAGKTRVSVFDCLGREILAIVDQNMAAGMHTAEFNETALRQGVYFLHIKHNAENAVVRFEAIAR